jgi:hypothetical protein
MMKLIHPRLRVPVITVVLGAAIVAAWVLGPTSRPAAIAFAVIAGGKAIGLAISQYVQAGQDSDVGAIYSSRADERQRQINQRAWAVTGSVAMAGSFVAFVITLAIAGAGRAWPFGVLLVLTVLSYGIGLVASGAAPESPADGPGAAREDLLVPVKPGS